MALDKDPTKRWFVKENRIAVFEAESRIEIYRRLDRILEAESVRPLREKRHWQFQILFDAADPPMATFISRGIGVPMQAHAEAVRYFADVEDLLAGAGPGQPPPAVGDVTQQRKPIEPGDRPIVEIEDLEPTPPGG